MGPNGRKVVSWDQQNFSTGDQGKMWAIDSSELVCKESKLTTLANGVRCETGFPTTCLSRFWDLGAGRSSFAGYVNRSPPAGHSSNCSQDCENLAIGFSEEYYHKSILRCYWKQFSSTVEHRVACITPPLQVPRLEIYEVPVNIQILKLHPRHTKSESRQWALSRSYRVVLWYTEDGELVL